MDNRAEAREFLATRRAKITPEQAGLPNMGDRRRVKGLRREEVAMLAGIGVDYYTRLERGNLGGVSESVLGAVARALQLDKAEHDHLFDLARSSNPSASSRRHASTQKVTVVVQQILDSMVDLPADVRNGRRDILATNRLGRALYSEMFADPSRPVNVARFTFLSPRAKDFFIDWDSAATDVVAGLRTEAGRDPYDKGLSDLIGELSTRSDEFRTRWAAHNVRQHTAGKKRMHHPVAGVLELNFQAMKLPGDTGLALVVYTAEIGSPSEEALKFLASWATRDDSTNLDHSSLTREPSRRDD